MGDRFSGLLMATVGILLVNILLSAWLTAQGIKHDQVSTAVVGGLLLGWVMGLALAALLSEWPIRTRRDQDRKP